MPKVECWFKQDLKKPVRVQTLNGNVFTLDNVGSLIGVEVYDNGSPATLSGSVNGYIILPDDTTVSVAGTRSGNKVSINLPQSALAIPGFIKIAVKLTNSSEITTLLAVVATVYKSRTDTIITPSQQIITDWSQQIAAEMQAVEDASALQDAKINPIINAAKHLYSITGSIGTDGVLYTGATQYRSTDFIPIRNDSAASIYDVYTGESTLAYAFYTADKTFISGQNSIVTSALDIPTIPSNAAYARFSSRITDASGSTITSKAVVYNFKLVEREVTENKEDIAAVDAKATASKNDFSNMEKAAMYDYSITGLINTSGVLQPTYTDYRSTDFIACDQNSAIAIYDFYTGSSSLAYAFFNANKGFISGQNNLASDKAFVQTIPSNAAYVRFSSKLTDGSGTSITPKAVIYNFKGMKEEVNRISSLIPTYNYPYTTGQFINTSGNLATNSDYAVTDFILCDNAAYVQFKDIYVGSSALAYAFYDKDKSFISGQNSISGDIIIQTIPSNARYLRSSCRVNNGSTVIHSPIITVYNNRTINKDIQELLDDVATLKNSGSNLKDLQILIFGDSITDTQNITIDASTDRTTAYSEKIPNNSYVKNGQTISYYMWPNLIQRVLDVKELRNYALAGAHFYTPSQTPSNPRIKLLYQVQVALNDLNNPNNVFPNDDFNPDIVIVACGINDGNITSGSFESAMNKTIMNQAGTGVDVEATMNNLNQSNVMESMRYVLMLLKQTFPTALFLYVNPLQQTYSTNEARLIAREELRKMAEQYDFVNLDGFAQFGVVRDFETQEQVGLLTKDGLHPNEKGQNLYARNIVQAIKRFYFPLNQFNT